MKEELNELENSIFDTKDIELLCEKIEQNMPTLLGDSIYFDIDDELKEKNIKLQSTFDESQLKIFKQYIEANQRAVEYQNCLAYYLGIKAGIEFKQLK